MNFINRNHDLQWKPRTMSVYIWTLLFKLTWRVRRREKNLTLNDWLIQLKLKTIYFHFIIYLWDVFVYRIFLLFVVVVIVFRIKDKMISRAAKRFLTAPHSTSEERVKKIPVGIYIEIIQCLSFAYACNKLPNIYFI